MKNIFFVTITGAVPSYLHQSSAGYKKLCSYAGTAPITASIAFLEGYPNTQVRTMKTKGIENINRIT